CCWFCKIAHNRNNRRFALSVFNTLRTVRSHPGSSTLGSSGVKIHVEYADMLTILFLYFISNDFAMINRYVVKFYKLKPVKTIAKVKNPVTNVIKTEILTNFFFINFIAFLTDFLGIVTPVIRFQFKAFTAFADFCLQIFCFFLCFLQSRLPK